MDNWTGEIPTQPKELLIETRPQGRRDTYAIRRRLEGICNLGGCPHGVGRDGDVNRHRGAYKWGLSQE